ncbi:hypothetical protein FQA39_LY01441 [Lamprigera yunnana]|nr:hypothetical protein FQA39_LY01441 [Lamprigera yunnana]
MSVNKTGINLSNSVEVVPRKPFIAFKKSNGFENIDCFDVNRFFYRSKVNERNFKYSFKPLRLKDLTQEILEAENEPLTKVPIEEPIDDPDRNKVETQDLTKVECKPQLEISLLNTLLKESEVDQSRLDNKLFSSTPKITSEFVAPNSKTTFNSDHLKVPNLTPISNEKVVKNINASRMKFDISQNKNNKLGVETSSVTEMKEIRINDANFLILNEIGKGASSIIYHCFNVKTKCERAVKKVNLQSGVACFNEVNLLERLQHCEYIIKFYDYEYIESEKTLLLVLEKGECDLAKIIKDVTTLNKHLRLHVIIGFWIDMLYAVQEIHMNEIIHADLKPANFLVVNGRLKLIDFGIASTVQNGDTSVARNFCVGTFNYISPEALTDQRSLNCESPNYSEPTFKIKYKSDVWSLGCILYELVYCKPPFHHISNMWAKFNTIVDPNHQIEYPNLDWVPSKIINIIKNCLQYNVNNRPSIGELITDCENYINGKYNCNCSN